MTRGLLAGVHQGGQVGVEGEEDDSTPVMLQRKEFKLEPDPILSLGSRLGIDTVSKIVKLHSDNTAIAISGSSISIINTASQHQRFLVGHDKEVATFESIIEQNLVVSVDEGDPCELIFWRVVPVRLIYRCQINLKKVVSMTYSTFSVEDRYPNLTYS